LQTQILVVTKGSRIDDKNLSPEGAHKAFQTIDDWAMANKIVHLLVRFNADDCSTAMNVLIHVDIVRAHLQLCLKSGPR